MQLKLLPAAEKWRAVLLLAGAGAFNYADRTVFSAVLPALREDLGLSDVTLGLLGSVFLWSYALSSPFAGGLADRYSRSLMAVVSLALWSLVTFFTGVANGFIALLLLRIALGLFQCLYLPAASALLGDLHGKATLGRAISLHLLGIYAGVVLGSTFSGFVAEKYGWRWAFWILGGAGVVLALICRRFLPDSPRKPRGTSAESAELEPGVPGAQPVGMAEAVKYLARTPSYLVLLGTAMMAGVAVWTFFNWMPMYFREAFNLSLAQAGFMGTALLQIASAGGLMAGGWISDRFAAKDASRRMVVFGIFYLAAAPFLMLFFSQPGFAVAIVAIVGFSFVRCIGAINEMPILCDVVPSRFRSTAIGIFNMSATAAGGVGILCAGFLKREFGLHTVFAGCSLTFVIAAIGLLIGARKFMACDMARASKS